MLLAVFSYSYMYNLKLGFVVILMLNFSEYYTFIKYS